MCDYYFEVQSHVSLARFRYVNFYGEPGPFLGSTDTQMERLSRTAVIVLLSPFLFFAPDIHYIAFYEIWCKHISQTDWSAFIRKLSTEWQDFVINVRTDMINSRANLTHLQATVLLNANIAFLAIQSIDDSSVDKGRSPAQVASYVSTIMSVGSIILGLLLLQKYRHKNRVYITSRVSCIVYHSVWHLICFLVGVPWHTRWRLRREARSRDFGYHVQLTLGFTHVGVSISKLPYLLSGVVTRTQHNLFPGSILPYVFHRLQLIGPNDRRQHIVDHRYPHLLVPHDIAGTV